MYTPGRVLLKKYSFFITLFVKLFALFPRRFNRFLFVYFRHTPGKLGLFIRYLLTKNLAKSCGDNISIHPGVYMFHVENISFGNNISIHPLCYIDGCGGLSIGNNVAIAHNTSILTVDHTWSDPTIPIKYNQAIIRGVHIGDDVWIGCGCRILSGITVESRVVLAAGAVLTKDAERRSLYAGVPAKKIKVIE